ncbi:putative DNA-binding protein [Clostridium oryzae]|uniref:UPF0122 protein CLORY_20900 n=1 Tax=Clostridium oryzae TaxID=1450648 RepID=A0A1V4IPP1_9CLOT|nr:putative DNA-binding protein [Clostridium oryzae]OPJ61784.1 putative DNA-binding protein [Clostridium oryzae]
MEDIIEVSMLLDNYGCLLTEKQFNIMSMYYYENLSLTEISEIMHTSRQATYDLIKRCNKQLYDYEKKLNLKDNLWKREKVKKDIIQQLDEAEKANGKEELICIISNIREKIMRDL